MKSQTRVKRLAKLLYTANAVLVVVTLPLLSISHVNELTGNGTAAVEHKDAKRSIKSLAYGAAALLTLILISLAVIIQRKRLH